jgi:GNAT superfamily N-acetyltransferase
MSVPERTWAFDRDAQERAARRVQQFDLGVAFYNDRLPRVYDANVVWVERGVEDLSADGFETLAESLQGGLGHRKLRLRGDAHSDRLAGELAARGWRAGRIVVMEYAGPHDIEPEGGAELVDPRAVRGARTDSVPGRQPDVGKQVAEYAEGLGRVAGGRVIAAFADGEVGAYCSLLEGEGVGEVDEVTTLDRFQRRGLGAAVVRAAIAASLSAGHDLTFILAVENDWPKDWYARLGFKTVGYRWEIDKTP